MVRSIQEQLRNKIFMATVTFGSADKLRLDRPENISRIISYFFFLSCPHTSDLTHPESGTLLSSVIVYCEVFSTAGLL